MGNRRSAGRFVGAALAAVGLAAAGLGAGLAATTAGRAAADPVADCTTTTGVVVAVDFAPWGGDIEVGCDPTETTGLTAIEVAGFTPGGTAEYGLAFICQINGDPADQSCATTPPADASWSYWYADAGTTTWSYSPVGVATFVPAPGSVEAWKFGSSGPDDPPAFTPSAVRATTPGPTPTTTSTAPEATTTTAAGPTATTVGGSVGGSSGTGSSGAGSSGAGSSGTGSSGAGSSGAGSSGAGSSGAANPARSTAGAAGTGSGPDSGPGAGRASDPSPENQAVGHATSSTAGAGHGSDSPSSSGHGASGPTPIVAVGPSAEHHPGPGSPWAVVGTGVAVAVLIGGAGLIAWRRRRAA